MRGRVSEFPGRAAPTDETSDLWARREALDPNRSFVVQAPAGSGKTGLLTQRYLKLLARVSAPEEILALTFTKKAAGEMRDRILEALHSARTQPRPEAEHAALSWDLATEVLARDKRHSWQVEENPQRLQVVTIDSLCSRLGHALPILSQFGASPQPVEDAQTFYNEAARRTLAHLDDPDSGCQAAVAHLLLHLDNDLRRVGQQIATLLERRERWMRPLLSLRSGRGFEDLDKNGRAVLEAALERVVREELAELREAFPTEALYQLSELLTSLATRYEPGIPHPLDPWRERAGLPGLTPEDAKLWKSLRIFLLNGKGNWRKTLNEKLGFLPAKSGKDAAEKAQLKADKARMRAILGELCEHEGLRRRLQDVQALPPVSYSDAQWITLRALLQVSVVAAAELLLVFKSWSKADFVEVAQRAERALGSDEEPTEVAMALDAKLQHILVDEFQDTSLGQLRLLERLTAEWTVYEKRTLFLVGDPMQSIYRFRDAEVGLFLRIRQEGLPNMTLQGLRLRSNFRSQAGLVEWFNEVFSQVFPPLESPITGSVPYSRAEAARPSGQEEPVLVHPVLVDSWGDPAGKQREADQVVAILRDIRREDPKRRVAILTRSRGHLETILPTLRREGFRYQGVDLEPLENRPVVRDLLALTRALVHPADRVAWLSVLRAPWCGLTSDDLHTVADDEGEGTIYDRLLLLEQLDGLSESGRLRLGQVTRVLGQAMSERRRLPLRRWVESIWLSLGGPATLESRSDLEDAQAYLGLLDRLGEEHSRPDLHLLEQRIAKLYAQPDVQADGTLQVMTIHKSKGLQFDTVILPGLSQPPRRPEEPLLSWLELARPDGGSDLLLAPITEKGDKDRDPVYKFVSSLENKKGENELARLLYVAATRAERQLHLVTRVVPAPKDKDFGQLKDPLTGSFLHMLWPALGEELASLVAPQFVARPGRGEAASPLDPEHPWGRPEAEPVVDEAVTQPMEVRRLCDDWVPPPTPPSVDISAIPRVVDLDMDERPSFEWAGENAKRVGSVVHRVLQQMGREGLAAWPAERLGRMRPYLESSLNAAGVPEAALPTAVARAQTALTQVLESPRGRWIFEQGGPEARSEYAISGVLRGRLVRAVVDRTFVDDQGFRWVVDYKTGFHEGGDPEAFLDAEMERYRPQLERYAAMLGRMDGRPVKMGLYFPLLGGWREWL
jgi:ATP-dependent exoDNAse (exonuclease V) beta subunit